MVQITLSKKTKKSGTNHIYYHIKLQTICSNLTFYKYHMLKRRVQTHLLKGQVLCLIEKFLKGLYIQIVLKQYRISKTSLLITQFYI